MLTVYKMVVLLCLASSYDACDETNAIAIDRMSRVAPYAARCVHDSQHEAAQLLYRDKANGGDPASRKIKVLCVPDQVKAPVQQ